MHVKELAAFVVFKRIKTARIEPDPMAGHPDDCGERQVGDLPQVAVFAIGQPLILLLGLALDR